MANDLSALIDRILARLLIHQRNKVLLPQLVNSDFSTELAQKGNTVDVKVPAKLAAYNIVPGATRTVGNETTPTTVPVTLSQHKGNGFTLTDKEITEINSSEDFITMEMQEAVNGLVNEINRHIADTSYPGIYGYAGTAGTTPFKRVASPDPTKPEEDTFILAELSKVLNLQDCPPENRRFVMNINADTNAKKLEAFKDASKLGDQSVVRRGELGELSGFQCFWQSYLPRHIAGTITTGLAAKSATAVPAGTKSFLATTAATTGACDLFVGDVINIAGHTTTYVLTAAAAQPSASSDVTLNVEPGLEIALAGDEAITVKASHTVNLAFNPFAFAFVMRRPQDFRPGSLVGEGAPSRVMRDNVTGLVLRLELLREHKQWYFEVDALYGAACVIPHLAARGAGE